MLVSLFTLYICEGQALIGHGDWTLGEELGLQL
jgi:hypothetical protein